MNSGTVSAPLFPEWFKIRNRDGLSCYANLHYYTQRGLCGLILGFIALSFDVVLTYNTDHLELHYAL